MHGNARTVALTRAVSPTLAACELTHLAREPIDPARAAADHSAYEDALRALGATVVRVTPAPDLPDAVFVEDTAIVLNEIAVITRPGAPSRRAETPAVAEVLGAYRTLAHIRAPATIDGGDVLRLGRTLYVGQSSRTNAPAIAQLHELLHPWEYRVVGVRVQGCLHLKSAITDVGEGVLLANPRWVDTTQFGSQGVIAVSDDEPGAANALRLAGAVVFPSHYPRTARRLERAGLRVVPVPCAELAKAEGGVTCCSLLVETESATS
ncbi:MAG TPA: hypothetical protein VJ992_08085 [Gemmatimonadales bacterium]|nr:hypothetical protein [Gemmatimonadales bacterium]